MSGFRYAVLLSLPLLLAACSVAERRSTPAPVVEAGGPPLQPPPPVELDRGAQTTPYRPPGGAVPIGPDADSVPAQQTPAPRAAGGYNAPAASLVAFADQAQGRGDYGQAASSLERALRIEPRNAYLWNRLARLRFSQGQYGEAGDLAAKSNALAGADRALKRDNWKMVAEARRAAGDVAGARAAEQQVKLLSR